MNNNLKAEIVEKSKKIEELDKVISEYLTQKTELFTHIADILNEEIKNELLKIDEINNATFRVWTDIEDICWTDLMLTIKVKKERRDFSNTEELIIYRDNLSNEVYMKLNNILGKKIVNSIMIDIDIITKEEGKENTKNENRKMP